MYKQCFELLTAQGPKPHKSFSVAQGTGGEVTKEFDGDIKGNIFSLSGQRIQLPPNPSHQTTDFHNTGTSATKKVGVTSSLNIVHQFLVFQVYIPTGAPFNIELHVRDKHNARRRLMLCDGTKTIVTNQMHARIPNTLVRRDCWTNLCLDINSFIKECFGRVTVAPYNTPQTQANQQPMHSNRLQQVGGGSGDIAALHKMGQVDQISKAAAVMAKNNASSNSNQNSMKTIEVIQLEGAFKIRKIFTSRSQIPADALQLPFGMGGAGATAMSAGTMRPEDIIQAAMIGQRIEQIPKNFDFAPQVERFSQVLTYEQVSGFMEQLRTSNSVEDSMMVTGLRFTTNTQNSGNGFPMSQLQNETDYSSTPNNGNNLQRNSFGIGAVQQFQVGYNMLNKGGANANDSGKKSGKETAAFRASSNDRGSSNGGEPLQTLSPNQMLDGSFRLGANMSKQTQASVVVVDEEANEQAHNSGLRSSGVSMRQGVQQKNGSGVSNATGDTIFKQANSTASNHRQRSNQTQSTAYSVRTTSSSNQNKGKVATGGANLQTSQSPFTDNASGGFSRKRSNGVSSGRPVYEQVDEMEESGSGQISLKLGEKQQTTTQDNRVGGPDINKLRIQSPKQQPQTNMTAQSAKVKRKAFHKTNVDTGLPQSSDKIASLQNQDPMTTPKLHQLQEVHQTTIMEENETLRGSMDRHPGSKIGLHTNNSNAKKFNRVQTINEKKTGANAVNNHNNQSGAGTRKAPAPVTHGKNVRTKSSVGPKEQNYQHGHPLIKGKAANTKVSMSSSNLDDSIGGIVGNKIQSRQAQNAARKQINANSNQALNNAISPNTVTRKSVVTKNQLQLSAQRKHRNTAPSNEQPQFQVRGGKTQSTAGKKQEQSKGSGAAQFLYNGSGYGSTAQNHMDSDGEQSDYKTTTLRFTNNNFINGEAQRRDGQNRDNSQGAPNRDSHTIQAASGQNNMTMLNTLNSQTGLQVQQVAMKHQKSYQQQNSYRRNSKQFGTSENFKVTAYNNKDHNGGNSYDQRTDGFSRLNNQSKSPVNLNRQFSTMQGRMQSDAGNGVDDEDNEEEEEEMIEEDICGQGGQSPPIQYQHLTNRKAKAIFHGQQLNQQQPPQVPAFRSTESDNFNMDTMMTGFGNIKIGATSPYAMNKNDTTPMHDKSSILATKPMIGGKPRHQLVKSPEGRSFNMGYHQGELHSEMRQGHNQYGIEEEIGLNDSPERQLNNRRVESPLKNGEVDPNETCTSDFYQVPSQGGIPVQLTIENGRRPFTPPFAQLIHKGKPPIGQATSSRQSGSRASNRVLQSQKPPAPSTKQPPEWIKPTSQATKPKILTPKDSVTDKGAAVVAKTGVVLVQDDAEREEEPIIEEEIEVGINSNTSPDKKKQQSNATKLSNTEGQESTTTETAKESFSKQSSSGAESRNKKQEKFHTFANEEQIEFTETYKRNVQLGIVDPTGSGSHTFGRRSRAQNEVVDGEGTDNNDDEELARGEANQQNQALNIQVDDNELEQSSASYLQRDVIDPQIVDQKKRLLYDKSLKAYYDPETGQYFEMKAQLIQQSSLGQFQTVAKAAQDDAQ